MEKNKGGRFVGVSDENFIKRQMSGLKELENQIKAELKANPNLNLLKVKKSIENPGELSFEGGGDFSMADAYMVVSRKFLDGMLALNGYGGIEGIGGMKPMIHKIGDGVILGKTAFIVDPKLEGFFAKNQIDGIVMDSALKINHEKLKGNTNLNTTYC